ncbi:hypothetical protein FACS189481_2370 [Clostridia bacterium]|nr:hypothetical protein FACS189481_2370 [Clostridia bacterium]
MPTSFADGWRRIYVEGDPATVEARVLAESGCTDFVSTRDHDGGSGTWIWIRCADGDSRRAPEEIAKLVESESMWQKRSQKPQSQTQITPLTPRDIVRLMIANLQSRSHNNQTFY